MPPELDTKLVHTGFCPPCLINDQISEIRVVQAGIQNRGGIFASKGQYGLDRKWMSHKDWSTKWRLIKIQCAHHITTLERLRKDHPEQAEEWGITQALEVWEQMQEECSRVPGCKYILDRMLADENTVSTPAVKQQKSAPPTLEELQEMWANDREWRVVKSKRKVRKARFTNSNDVDEPALEPNADNAPSTASKPHEIRDTSAPDGIGETDESVLKEVESVKHRKDEALEVGNWNLFDAISDVEGRAMRKDTTLDSSASPSPGPSAAEGGSKSCSPAAKPTPLSAPRDTACAPRSRLRVTFSDTTTVLSHHSFSLEDLPSPTQQPHNPHTTAEQSRPQYSFHRTHSGYKPSTWSSNSGLEKLNTSCYAVSWDAHARWARGGTWSGTDRATIREESDLDVIAEQEGDKDKKKRILGIWREEEEKRIQSLHERSPRAVLPMSRPHKDKVKATAKDSDDLGLASLARPDTFRPTFTASTYQEEKKKMASGLIVGIGERESER